MKILNQLIIIFMIMALVTCKGKIKQESDQVNDEEFPSEMAEFLPYKDNPVFESTGKETWDKHIRERGYIIFEDSVYKMWYTGYTGADSSQKSLGYATSPDGIHWTRYAGNPVFNNKWTEDMFVVKNEGKFYMYAEGRNDVAHLLTSDDGINWHEEGDLVIRKANGDSIPAPYGTPTVWVENGKWYLFYEINDAGIWLAQSNDKRNWKNIQDDPVLRPGPERYDSGAIAVNQVVKYNGKYYFYYHASSAPMESSTEWTSNLAMSTDLIHWRKYPKNPLVKGDHSSPITVFDGTRNRLYTMHPEVYLYFSKLAN